jgi:hypothetical protein
MTHAGNSYNCGSVAAIKAMAVQERDAVVTAASARRCRRNQRHLAAHRRLVNPGG